MLNYQVKPPKGKGDFLIGYPTPGAEHVFTVAGTASDKEAAAAECARLNEEQVADLRIELTREPNTISNDLHEQRGS